MVTRCESRPERLSTSHMPRRHKMGLIVSRDMKQEETK